MSQIPPPPGAMPPGHMPYQSPPPGAGQSQGLAIASLICGILAIFTFCLWILSVPLGLAAIIMGIIARTNASKGQGGGKGLATAGMICGIVGILISVLAIVGLLSFGKKIQEEAERMQREQQRQQQQGPSQELVLPAVR